ncbi:hypothetical protein KAH55_02720, partial [bacterium]|nr:hypothetical protein [bacterium]
EHNRDDVLRRQRRVRELKGLSFFRNRLQLNFRLTGVEALHGNKIKNWLHNLKSEKKLRNRLLIAGGLWAMTWMLVLGHFFLAWPGFWWYGALAALSWYMGHKKIWGDLGADAEILDSEFRQAVTIFQYLEKFNYSAYPQLKELCEPFATVAEKPSRQLRRMNWLAFAVGLRMNYLFWIILHLFSPWDFWCAYRLNIQKRRLKKQFAEWLEICYELEALNSLANFAWLNPAAVFPELMESVKTSAVFLEAAALGHPLISYHHRVGNPVTITPDNKVHLITGSNMAGKSTFLRTIGINLILARAGSPVIASRMTAGLYQIFTCIKVNDSVSDGYSQFYAEVRRLRALLDVIEAQKTVPVLFLIDEIYRGTNNRERLIGSRAFVDKLLNYENCFGMITTHDLELTQMGTAKTAISNFHFRETVVNRKMEFDYVLRLGPCPTTNALLIMAMEGLPVGTVANKNSRQT